MNGILILSIGIILKYLEQKRSVELSNHGIDTYPNFKHDQNVVALDEADNDDESDDSEAVDRQLLAQGAHGVLKPG